MCRCDCELRGSKCRPLFGLSLLSSPNLLVSTRASFFLLASRYRLASPSSSSLSTSARLFCSLFILLFLFFLSVSLFSLSLSFLHRCRDLLRSSSSSSPLSSTSDGGGSSTLLSSIDDWLCRSLPNLLTRPSSNPSILKRFDQQWSQSGHPPCRCDRATQGPFGCLPAHSPPLVPSSSPPPKPHPTR